MRDHVRAFCRIAAEVFDAAGPVIEFGAFQVPGQEYLADLRPLFPGRTFIGCDARPGPGVDRIDDIAASSFDSDYAGTVVCLDTLEHVFQVIGAFGEMHRVLQPGGVLIAATTMRFPIHEHPQDFWRMTPACIDRLSGAFAFRVVGSQGTASFPHTVFLLAVKSPVPADVQARAALLITTYTAWLHADMKRRPWAAVLRQKFKELYRSKGERRELRNQYVARFEVAT